MQIDEVRDTFLPQMATELSTQLKQELQTKLGEVKNALDRQVRTEIK
jgi:hypothetical protein